MSKDKQHPDVPKLINTSVDDCKISLQMRADPKLLCDLLIECNRIGHTSREQIVRRRIAKLIKGF